MVDQSRRDRVGLGLIGLGPSWEAIYREPLMRLQHRLKIRFVYDPVQARARSVASEIEADVAESLSQILTRQTLQGLLILDPGWCPAALLDLAVQSGKPTFLGGAVLRGAAAEFAQGISNSFESEERPECQPRLNEQFMPELGLRFTPASCRLRELIATKIGPARQIQILCDLRADLHSLAAVVDWCHDIMGGPSSQASMLTSDSDFSTQFELHFPDASDQLTEAPGRRISPTTETSFRDSEPAHAVDRLQKLAVPAKRVVRLRQYPERDSSVWIAIECERGYAELKNRTRIVWRTPSESADELLTHERTETEILIDQFCRRALGGLNPVGRLSEFTRAMEVAASIQRDDF